MPLRSTIVLGCALAVAAAVFALAVNSASAQNPKHAHGAATVTYTPKLHAPYYNGQSSRYDLNGQWYFAADPRNDGLAARFQRTKDFALAGWTPVTIPNAWNANDFSPASNLGTIGWYGTSFRVPRGAAGSQWVFHFDSVNYFARVYLNGRQVARHSGAYVPFETKARKLRRGVNTLVVRVDNRLSADTVPPQEDRADGQTSGGWWDFGGILRDVNMRRVRTLDLADVAIRSRQACRRCVAQIEAVATVRNVTGHKVRGRLTGTIGGKRIRFPKITLKRHRAVTVIGKTRIRKPRLWEPGRPHLYRAAVMLGGPGGVLAVYRLRTGIRSLHVSRNGIMTLNGKRVQLSGVSLHESAPGVGAAWTPAIRAQTEQWIKDLGANLIRSHYPLDPQLMQWADRNGILVWVEAPVYRPGDNLLKKSRWRRTAIKAVEQMVIANRSHPSVLVWSLVNEPVVGTDRYLSKYVYPANRLVKQLDPRGLTAIDVASSPRTTLQQPSYRKVDVLGLNQYFGWYPGSQGSTVDPAGFGPYADSFHELYDRQALFVTEFGAEANRDGPADELGTYDFQANFFIYHLREMAKKSYINGEIAWILRDFPVRPDWVGGDPAPTPPLSTKGLIGWDGVPKPAFEEVKRAYSVRRPFK